MRTLALAVLALSAGAVGAAWCSRHSDGDWQEACADLRHEQQRSQALDVAVEQRRRFATFCEKEMFEVVFGIKRLVNACRRIEAYAAANHPVYLEHLAELGQGRTLRDKIVHSILAGCTEPRRGTNGGAQVDRMFALRMIAESAEVATTPDALDALAR